MKMWQHEDTGKIIEIDITPSKKWFELSAKKENKMKHSESWKNMFCMYVRFFGLKCPHCEAKKPGMEYK